jgi:hypothetical protein
MTVTESKGLKKGSRVNAHMGHPVSPTILKTPYSSPFRAIMQARKSASKIVACSRASSCVRDAEPSHIVLSAGHGGHLRRSVSPDAPWPRSMAAAARCRLSRAAGSGLMPLPSSTTPGRAAKLPPSLVVLDFRNESSSRMIGPGSQSMSACLHKLT